MPSSAILTTEAMAVAVGLVAVLIGWLLRSWVGTKEMTSREEMLRVRESQISSLQQDLDAIRALRPFHVQQYLLAVAQRLADELGGLERQIHNLETSKARLENKIKENSAQVDVHLMSIAELEEQKRAIREFEHGLRKLIDRSQAETRMYFESGDQAVAAAGQEIAGVTAKIAEHRAAMAKIREATAELERESAGLSIEIDATGEKCNAIRTRKENFHAAADSILEGEAALLAANSDSRPVPQRA